MGDAAMKKGDRVQTNAKFSKIFSGGAVWRGELVDSREVGEKKPFTQWRVRVDGMPNLQTIAEGHLAKEKKA
jgi:hypothetical protein